MDVDDNQPRPNLKRKASASTISGSGPQMKKPKLEGKAKKYEKKINHAKQKYRRGPQVKLEVPFLNSIIILHSVPREISTRRVRLAVPWPGPFSSLAPNNLLFGLYFEYLLCI